MGILILLVPISILLAAGGVAAFVWACRSRQFDDLDAPAYKLILDDQSTRKEHD